MPFDKKKHDEEPPVTEETEAATPAEAPEAEEQPEDAAAKALEAAQAQAEEYLNLAQRVQADFDNYRKRTKGIHQTAAACGG